MPATSRRAQLISDLLSVKAAPRAGENASSAAARAAAEGVFFGKGAASAASFKPAYWSYDRDTAAAAPAPAQPADAKALQEMLKQHLEPAVALDEPAATAPSGGEHPPVITADEAIDMQNHAEAGALEEFEAAQTESVAAARPDELAERVLNYRSYAGRSIESAPRGGGSVVTSDSLLAELASARESRSTAAPARRRAGRSAAPEAPASLIDRLFALAGVAIVAFGAFIYFSPGHGAAFYGGRSIQRLVNTF